MPIVARHLRLGGPFHVCWPLNSVDVQNPSCRGMNEPAERLKAFLLDLVARSAFRE